MTGYTYIPVMVFLHVLLTWAKMSSCLGVKPWLSRVLLCHFRYNTMPIKILHFSVIINNISLHIGYQSFKAIQVTSITSSCMLTLPDQSNITFYTPVWQLHPCMVATPLYGSYTIKAIASYIMPTSMHDVELHSLASQLYMHQNYTASVKQYMPIYSHITIQQIIIATFQDVLAIISNCIATS